MVRVNRSIVTHALALVAAIMLLGIPGRALADICCNPATTACTVLTSGTCPSGSVTIGLTTCSPNPCLPRWVTGAWGTCSATCGGGIQTRIVLCASVSGVILADSQCASTPKPPTQQACNTQACETFSWSVGPWSNCTVTCGGGTQTRTVQCISSVTGTAVADFNCASTTKPPTQQACNTQACETFSWAVGPWTICSAECGGGTQTRTVLCRSDLTGVIVSNTFCTTSMPPTQQTCNPGPCAGACCIGTTCTVVSPAACSTAAGRYVGNLSACNVPGNVVVPCCRADFDQSGTLAIVDIFGFLNAWFASSASADFNGGGITLQDIFDFLNAWFVGC